jgi:hypothetical protein
LGKVLNEGYEGTLIPRESKSNKQKKKKKKIRQGASVEEIDKTDIKGNKTKKKVELLQKINRLKTNQIRRGD